MDLPQTIAIPDGAECKNTVPLRSQSTVACGLKLGGAIGMAIL